MVTHLLISIICRAQLNEKTYPIKQFKVGNYWLSLKNTFDFSALKKQTDDTLWLEVCSDNLFSPFGVFGDTNQLKKAQLKNYEMKNRVGVGDEANVVQATLWHDMSNITLYFFHSSESSPHSYIIQGNVFDRELVLFKTVQIGMNRSDFYKTFFNSFPKELEKNFRFVIFETCVFGIQEIYRLEDSGLASVRFRCPNCVGVKRIDKY